MPRYRSSIPLVARLIVAMGLVMVFNFAAPAEANERNLPVLRAGQTYSRFIVKFRDGSDEQASLESKQQSLDAAAAGAGSGRKFSLKHLRRLSIGSDVVQADRQLDHVEAQALMRRIAADPRVEYVEVDNLKQIAEP
jgi:serine protease